MSLDPVLLVKEACTADAADFARTKKALDTCPFCYQEERNPLTAVVALGTRTYMCCTLTEELVPGHCLIVPIQHYMSSLEMDDEDWEEVKVRSSRLALDRSRALPGTASISRGKN